MPLVAGIDSSTQSCKVVVRDLDDGRIVRTGRAAHPLGTEVDPEHWWRALLEAVAAAGGLEDVAAVSIAGQQHGMVALDAAGETIRPALLWHDTRSAPQALALIEEFGAAELARRTGSVPVASFTATKLRWLREHEPEHAARVAAVALPHDWLTWRLLGRRAPGAAGGAAVDTGLEALRTDRSDASGTSYFDPRRDEYDRELLTASLGHDAILPRVLGPSEAAGETDGAVAGIPSGILVGAGAGDNAGAALGLGLRTGDVAVSIGTSGTVFAVTDAPTADASGAVAGFADASGHHLPLAATLNAARVLDAISGLLGVDHDELGRLALASEPGAAGAVLQPYFEGERTPNRPDATATLFGLTLASTTREHLARAAIEGMLCGLADGLDAVRAQGVEARQVSLIGGAAQNRAVAAIAAQVLDLPIAVPVPGEVVAAGASVQAGWALTGSRPVWPVEIADRPDAAHEPRILEQYRARVAG
ncbi:xylulokinase [Homoserinibacter sp. YIM 151385]|uniref:xylulokinase n=1 Tax=Homoserinibacter sp. YIM 151385 TaxID=2985506 RepID=UPI0022EFD9E6|nr:xylulokinase [Homoserinibacter sp. YIM 151385]WBU36900.1 xylulokinase [Homoserinibacter sp. YIM 151385]